MNFRWRAIAARSGARVCCIFQFVGFKELPEISPKTMESILELQPVGGDHGFDLGQSCLPQIIVDDEAIPLGTDSVNPHHFADALANALHVQIAGIYQS